MLAKGWLLGLQFEQLFQDNLYFDLGRHGTELAMKFKQAVSKAGYSFLLDSPTNQQFVIFPNELLEKIAVDFTYEVQEKVSATHTAVRFCFSWATKEENVDKLIGAIV